MDDSMLPVLVSALSVLVASLSFVVASLALGWNIAQWLLTNGRARATLLHGLRTLEGAYIGPVTKAGNGYDMEILRSQGIHGHEVVGLEIANVGRTPLTVQKIALHPVGDACTYVPVGDLEGPDLPHRIEPGDNATWVVPADVARALQRTAAAVSKKPVTGIYMSATTGTGKVKKAPRVLRISSTA